MKIKKEELSPWALKLQRQVKWERDRRYETRKNDERTPHFESLTRMASPPKYK